jgi:hypothetical protein
VKTGILSVWMLMLGWAVSSHCDARKKASTPSLTHSFAQLSEAAAKARDDNQDDEEVPGEMKR